MSQPYIEYAKQISSGLRYGATWTPGTPLRLGQVGTFESGIFVPRGHIESFDIPFTTETDSTPTSYTYISDAGVLLRFKTKDQSGQSYQSLIEGQAGVAISFSKKHRVVFSATECFENRIADTLSLQAQLTHRFNRKMWQEDWAVVTHLVTAKSATILLSNTDDSVIELEIAGSNIPSSIGLVDISANIALAYSGSMSQLILGAKGLTPLFHTMRLRKQFWSGEPKVVFNKSTLFRKDGGTSSIQNDGFERIDFDMDSAKMALKP